MSFDEWKTRYHKVDMPEDLKLNIQDVLVRKQDDLGINHHRKANKLGSVITGFAAVATLLMMSGGIIYKIHTVRNGAEKQGVQHGNTVHNVSSPASVAVYPPVIDVLPGGSPPMQPSIDTQVDSPVGKVTKLTVHVTLQANAKSVTFQPVMIHVDSAPGDGASYHQTYTVTSNDVHLNSHHDARFDVVIPVPSASGGYTVFADSPTFDPSQRRELINVMYVNHGGFYQTGVVKTELHKQSGEVGVTVTEIDMTPSRTRILFYLTGKGATLQSQLWGNPDKAVQQVLSSNGTSPPIVDSMNLGSSLGPIPAAQRSGEWDTGPTRADAQEIKFNLNLLMPNSPNSKPSTYRFSFAIPLKR